MYTEVSFAQKGWTARLQSPTYTYKNAAKCASIWYHMYGTNIGKLDILLGVSGAKRTTLWSANGKSYIR